MTTSNNNSLDARLAALIASVNADSNATDEDRQMAKLAEATLARRGREKSLFDQSVAKWEDLQSSNAVINTSMF